MTIEPWVWAAFGVFVVAMLLVDLVLFGRRGEEITLRRAIGWSVGWSVLGLAFAALIWAWQGRELASAYLAGFLIEKSLSVDNLFVFALIFAYFGVPAILQRRVLFWASWAQSSCGRSSSRWALPPSTRFTSRRICSASSW